MRKTQKIVPIVTASDENYAPYLNVMMTTVLENCHSERPVHFYVIDDGLSLSSKKALRETVSSNSQSATVEFLTADKEVYQNFLVSDHITTTAYLRISLPSLLQKYSYKKVLYLDADTLVLDDIVQLYDTPLVNQTIGAVIDPGQAYALKRLGIHSSDYYFNSGVMIIDIDRWNEKAITKNNSVSRRKWGPHSLS